MKILARYILAWMGCLGMMNLYFCRINLSVALVAMVGVSENSDNDTLEEHCKERGGGEESPAESAGEFDWSPSWQGLLTGSYYYGYTAGQVQDCDKTQPHTLLCRFLLPGSPLDLDSGRNSNAGK